VQRCRGAKVLCYEGVVVRKLLLLWCESDNCRGEKVVTVMVRKLRITFVVRKFGLLWCDSWDCRGATVMGVMVRKLLSPHETAKPRSILLGHHIDNIST